MASRHQERTPIRWLERCVGAVLSRYVLAPDRLLYATPTEFGLTALPLEIGAGHFRGYEFLPSASEAAAAPVVVFFPGVSANLSAHILYVELAVRAGLRVIAFDYRGFGASAGTPSVADLLADAHRVCDVALGKTDGRIGLFGTSLGANVALAIAADRPRDIAAVAIEGLSDQRDVIEGILANGLSGPRSVRNVYVDETARMEREMLRLSRLRAPRFAAKTASRIAESTYPFRGKSPRALMPALGDVPLCVVHGIDDPVLPFELSLDVFPRSGHPSSRLWLIPEIGHAQEPALGADAEYVGQLKRFFSPSPGTAAASDNATHPTLEIEANAAGTSLRVSLPPDASAGAFLIGSFANDVVDLWRIWLAAGERVTRPLRGKPVATWALRTECAERCGSSWDAVLSPRSKLYRDHYRTPLARLSSSMRRANVAAAKDALQGLLDLSPPNPFDLYLRIHAARLATVARRRAPSVAEWARSTFRALGGRAGDTIGIDRNNGNRGRLS